MSASRTPWLRDALWRVMPVCQSLWRAIRCAASPMPALIPGRDGRSGAGPPVARTTHRGRCVACFRRRVQAPPGHRRSGPALARVTWPRWRGRCDGCGASRGAGAACRIGCGAAGEHWLLVVMGVAEASMWESGAVGFLDTVLDHGWGGRLAKGMGGVVVVVGLSVKGLKVVEGKPWWK